MRLFKLFNSDGYYCFLYMVFIKQSNINKHKNNMKILCYYSSIYYDR